MGKINSFLRTDEWLTSKVTMMVGVFMYIMYLGESTVGDIFLKAISYFAFTACFLAVSYVVNDLSDIEADKKAGKKKVIAGMPLWTVYLAIVFLFAVGNLPCLILAGNKGTCAGVIIVVYLFGIAYSVPGIRFKEKGIWGLIECSVAQRCLPLLMILCLEKMTVIKALILCGWFVISFLDGLRYILIHQLIDLENDQKSGINTYASAKSQNYGKMIGNIFAVELCLTALTMLGIFISSPIVCSVVCGVICALYIYMEYCIYKVLNVYAGKNWLLTFDSVPLEAFLNMVMPLMAGICMLTVSPLMIIYCLAIIAVCSRPMMVKLNIAKVYIDSKKPKKST